MENESSLATFLNSVRQQGLGEVASNQTSMRNPEVNVGNFHRKVSATICVADRTHIEKLVNEARKHKIALYPYSRGHNWGYGSKLPVQTESVLVDLSQLNRILEIDETHGIATIEPGVTQNELAEELKKRGSRYYLDVTGSGADTSVLGNAIERGVAYGSLRVQQLAGIEVVLGTGESLKTGFGAFPNPVLDGLYPYGLGPSLDGLFFQSNFGIVVQGKIQLTLRSDSLFALSVSVPNSHLSKFVEKTGELVRKRVLSGIPHLANRERSVSTIVPLLMDQSGKSHNDARKIVENVIKDEWMLTAAVADFPSIAREKIKVVKNSLKGLGRIHVHEFNEPKWKAKTKGWLLNRVLTSEQRLVIEAAEQLRKFHKGEPSDSGIRFLLNSKNGVDQSDEGFLLCTPLAPLSGRSAIQFAEIADSIANSHKVRFAMTLNILNPRILEAVISVHFLRSQPEERDRAHLCVDKMTAKFSELGFYPYRINIDQHETFLTIDPVRGRVNRALKDLFDPSGIIAPGRYV